MKFFNYCVPAWSRECALEIRLIQKYSVFKGSHMNAKIQWHDCIIKMDHPRLQKMIVPNCNPLSGTINLIKCVQPHIQNPEKRSQKMIQMVQEFTDLENPLCMMNGRCCGMQSPNIAMGTVIDAYEEVSYWPSTWIATNHLLSQQLSSRPQNPAVGRSRCVAVRSDTMVTVWNELHRITEFRPTKELWVVSYNN